ncbi:hypothetical protein [Gilliamella apicola]|uniref:hypothetical protein n=1 Tax=Gilliamella apicola TaxID=1196095 RepID=UPI002FEE4112
MQQETLNTILTASGWIGLIILCPFLWRFSCAFIIFIYYKLFPYKTLWVEYKHNGVLIKRTKVKLNSKDPIVRQLNETNDEKENYYVK